MSREGLSRALISFGQGLQQLAASRAQREDEERMAELERKRQESLARLEHGYRMQEQQVGFQQQAALTGAQLQIEDQRARRTERIQADQFGQSLDLQRQQLELQGKTLEQSQWANMLKQAGDLDSDYADRIAETQKRLQALQLSQAKGELLGAPNKGQDLIDQAQQQLQTLQAQRGQAKYNFVKRFKDMGMPLYAKLSDDQLAMLAGAEPEKQPIGFVGPPEPAPEATKTPTVPSLGGTPETEEPAQDLFAPTPAQTLGRAAGRTITHPVESITPAAEALGPSPGMIQAAIGPAKRVQAALSAGGKPTQNDVRALAGFDDKTLAQLGLTPEVIQSLRSFQSALR